MKWNLLRWLLLSLLICCEAGKASEIVYTKKDVQEAMEAFRSAVANNASEEEIKQKKLAFEEVVKAIAQQRQTATMAKEKKLREDAEAALTPEQRARNRKLQDIFASQREEKRLKKIEQEKKRIAKQKEKERRAQEKIAQAEEREREIEARRQAMEDDKIRRSKLPKLDLNKDYYYVRAFGDKIALSKLKSRNDYKPLQFLDYELKSNPQSHESLHKGHMRELIFKPETQQFLTTRQKFSLPYCDIIDFQEVSGLGSIIEYIDVKSLHRVHLHGKAFKLTNEWLPQQSTTITSCVEAIINRETCAYIDKCAVTETVSMKVDYGYLFESFNDAKSFYEAMNDKKQQQ